MNAAFAIPHFAGRIGYGLTLNPCSMKHSIVITVSEALEALKNLKNTLITFIKKTFTNLKHYKNLGVISVTRVVWTRID